MNKTKISWSSATDNIQTALHNVIECINAGYNAWLEVRENADPDIGFPITIKNPALDNPFNWRSSYGTLRSGKRKEESYFNDTEKDLTENWISAFGTKEAIKKYQECGEITKDLIIGGGTEHPIRIKDANEHRKRFIKDGYQYNLWEHAWVPKPGIPYYIPKVFDDKNPTEPLKVFVVCHDDTPPEQVTKIEAFRRAEKFLHEYIDFIEKDKATLEQNEDEFNYGEIEP